MEVFHSPVYFLCHYLIVLQLQYIADEKQHHLWHLWKTREILEAMERGNYVYINGKDLYIVFHFCGWLTLLDPIVSQHSPCGAEMFFWKTFLPWFAWNYFIEEVFRCIILKIYFFSREVGGEMIYLHGYINHKLKNFPEYMINSVSPQPLTNWSMTFPIPISFYSFVIQQRLYFNCCFIL